MTSTVYMTGTSDYGPQYKYIGTTLVFANDAWDVCVALRKYPLQIQSCHRHLSVCHKEHLKCQGLR